MDCHFSFGNCVHRRRNEWYLKFDIFGNLGGNINVVKTEVNMPWHHDEIIVSVGYAGLIIAKDFLRRITGYFRWIGQLIGRVRNLHNYSSFGNRADHSNEGNLDPRKNKKGI